MARFRTKTISRRTVEALKVEKDTVFWDREPRVRGAGVSVGAQGLHRAGPREGQGGAAG